MYWHELDGWLEREEYWARRLDLAFHRRCVLEFVLGDARAAGRDRRVAALTPQLAQACSEEVRARAALVDTGAAIDNMRFYLRQGYRGREKDREIQARRGLAA